MLVGDPAMEYGFLSTSRLSREPGRLEWSLYVAVDTDSTELYSMTVVVFGHLMGGWLWGRGEERETYKRHYHRRFLIFELPAAVEFLYFPIV